MRSDATTLARAIERYRTYQEIASHPRVIAALDALIAEATAKLAAVNATRQALEKASSE